MDPFDKSLEIDKFINIEYVQYDTATDKEVIHKIKKCYRTDFGNASLVWDNYLTYDWTLMCPERMDKAVL